MKKAKFWHPGLRNPWTDFDETFILFSRFETGHLHDEQTDENTEL